MQTGPSLGPRRLPKARSTNEYQRGSYATILLYAIARFGKTNLLRQLLKAGYKEAFTLETHWQSPKGKMFATETSLAGLLKVIEKV